MPNLDGGHYFLTAIIPINNAERDGLKNSPVHKVREALETLPTALQSPATEKTGIQSPFARSLRTHFARFSVLDDANFNGRNGVNSIVTAIKGTDLVVPQPVDQITCPYLIFCVDFDPQGDGVSEPRSYLEELWTLMSPELTAVMRYCYGFNEEAGPAAFADLVIACQVETTMPFNDYWVGSPPIPSQLKWFLIAPAVAVVASIWAGWMLATSWWMTILVILALLVVSVAPVALIDYALAMWLGSRPFPTAPNSTLRDVLKALYLQQNFTRFAIDHQGQSPEALHRAFADFVTKHAPANVSAPTQAPGVIQA